MNSALQEIAADVRPARELFRSKAESSNLIPVHAEILADDLTPISAYRALVGDGTGFLLESVERGEKVGRYSFIGLEPWDVLVTDGEDPLSAVERRLSGYRVAVDPALPRFSGGAVGYIGYDCIRYFEPRLRNSGNLRDDALFAGALESTENGLPEAAFQIAGMLVIFDHVRRRAILVVNSFIEPGADPNLAYDRALEELVGLRDALQRSSGIEQKRVFLNASAGARGGSERDALLASVKSNMTRGEFTTAVEKAKRYIEAGDAFQIVLSQRFCRKVTADPFDVYRALRAVNPSPYMYYMKFPGFTIAGSSPEVMVRLEGTDITLRPIAGTRPRGANEEEDQRLERELLADAKELAEHIMLVDLGRNDVGRVARCGSVRVNDLMVVERYSHVMHIVSNVVGELDGSRSACDVIRSAFPAGTVSGAPKIRAMEIIAELEPTRRGPYAGALGYIGFDGNADTAIVLRTITMKDGVAHVQAGAGIVYDSVADNEFEETVNKASAMMKALVWAEEGL